MQLIQAIMQTRSPVESFDVLQCLLNGSMDAKRHDWIELEKNPVTINFSNPITGKLMGCRSQKGFELLLT